MWITYYQCHLHLINLLTRINYTLSSNPEAYLHGREYARLRNECSNIVDGVYASLPFMLMGESIYGTRPKLSVWLQARPPMLIGGLNLQWILFTISILNIVSTSSRQNAKVHLLWIGKNLGIGQATVLAHVRLHSRIWTKTKFSRWIKTQPAVSPPKVTPLLGQVFLFDYLSGFSVLEVTRR